MRETSSPLECETSHRILQPRPVPNYYPAYYVLIARHVLHHVMNKTVSTSGKVHSFPRKLTAGLPLYTRTQPATSLICRLLSRLTTAFRRRKPTRRTATARVSRDTHYLRRSSKTTMNYLNLRIMPFYRNFATMVRDDANLRHTHH